MTTRGTRRTKARPMKTDRERIDELAQSVGIPEQQWPHLGMGKVVDLSGELGGKRMSIVNVLVNRGGTAVERWIANDKTGLFEEGQQRAIRYTQGLWLRADGRLKAIDTTRDVVDDHIDGMSQQEALDELTRLKGRIPRPFWDCYENVCRFDEEAGTAGSRLANNSRSAIDAARTTVAFTASLIAQWRRL
jgi:hypothetical protein